MAKEKIGSKSMYDKEVEPSEFGKENTGPLEGLKIRGCQYKLGGHNLSLWLR